MVDVFRSDGPRSAVARVHRVDKDRVPARQWEALSKTSLGLIRNAYFFRQ